MDSHVCESRWCYLTKTRLKKISANSFSCTLIVSLDPNNNDWLDKQRVLSSLKLEREGDFPGLRSCKYDSILHYLVVVTSYGNTAATSRSKTFVSIYKLFICRHFHWCDSTIETSGVAFYIRSWWAQLLFNPTDLYTKGKTWPISFRSMCYDTRAFSSSSIRNHLSALIIVFHFSFTGMIRAIIFFVITAFFSSLAT